MSTRCNPLGFAATVGSLALLATTASAALHVQVLDADWVRARCAIEPTGQTSRFASLGGVPVELSIVPATAGVVNPASDGSFHPFRAEAVRAALDEMAPVPGPDLYVTVYCLPGLPSSVRASFAVGHEVFLAAGVGEISPRVTAYTVVHELGHVVQHALLPAGASARWQRYLRERGLTDGSRYHPRAQHRDRPAEIFAEDFRALFGGPLATASGTIENAELPMPQSVPGLAATVLELLGQAPRAVAALAWVGNHPNPFNPSTTMRFALRDDLVAGGGLVRVEVIDLRGRRVRTLPPVPVAPEVSAHWDGHDDDGRTAAAGRYYVRAIVDGQIARGSILLVK